MTQRMFFPTRLRGVQNCSDISFFFMFSPPFTNRFVFYLSLQCCREENKRFYQHIFSINPENILKVNMNKAIMKNKGFALIELLVGLTIGVILIAGFLILRQQTQPPLTTPLPTSTLLPETTTQPPEIPTEIKELSPTPPLLSSQGKIAFVRDGDIWLINADGGGEEELFDFSKIYNNSSTLSIKKLRWSPNGSHLAFVINTPTDNTNELRVLTLASKKTNLLFTTGAVGPIWDFAWAPSSKELVVSYPSNDKTLVLKIVSLENSSSLEPFLAWDVPITKLAVHSGWVYFLDKNQKLWKALYAGPRFYPLAKDKKISDFDLSPDGTKLVVKKNSNLWQIDLASGDEKQLTTDGYEDYTDINNVYTSYSNLHWSPDSNKIAFDFGQGLDAVGIGYIDQDGSNLRVLWINDFKVNESSFLERVLPKTTAFAAVAPPVAKWGSWSSDSRSFVVVYHHQDLKLRKDLRIYHLPSGEISILTTNASQPAWSPR